MLAPPSATDLTPFARQVQAPPSPDLVYVAWAGSTAPALWTALDQQGVLTSTKVVTGLAGTASYPLFGSAGGKVDFLAHYFPGAGGGNPVEKAMLDGITKAGGTPDLFSPDGFTAALMIVHAVQAGAGGHLGHGQGPGGLELRRAEGRPSRYAPPTTRCSSRCSRRS